MLLIVTYLTIICLSLLGVNAQECPMDAELQKILDTFVVDVDIKQLEGTWMDIYVPAPYKERVSSSYSEFKGEGALLKVTGHDFLNSGKDTVYYETFKKIKENKGIFSFTGTYIDGSTFTRLAYFIHVNKDANVYYSCDPKFSTESSWHMSVKVNADKKKDLLETPQSPNVAQMALNDAVGRMDDLAEEDAKWRKSHEGKFGLVGPMSKLDLTKLRSN